MADYHPLLRRQIKRHLAPQTPLDERSAALLSAVSAAYEEYDAARRFVERALELSSGELHAANAELRGVLDHLPDVLFRVVPPAEIAGVMEASACPAHPVIAALRENAAAGPSGTTLAPLAARVRARGEAEAIEVSVPSAAETRTFEVQLLPFVGDDLLGIAHDITERKQAEKQLADTYQKLVELSRFAGMAEVATDVLHNVGNVLNSVNVSATFIQQTVKNSKTAMLAKLSLMLQEHTGDLAEFLTRDPKGTLIPSYLMKLAEQVSTERDLVMQEIDHLRKNIEHINDIVSMQQNYAKVSGLTETVPVVDLIEDALRIGFAALPRDTLQLEREYRVNAQVTVERHKVVQVLVNLIKNATHACHESDRPDKILKVQVTEADGRVRIAVIDNGVGIAPENLTRIFAHGFTTRKEGHGFGLHSGALIARELGGSLTAHSDGPDAGSAFTLHLPLAAS